jgi:FMN phosphatase YigB (HAD superfamily)
MRVSSEQAVFFDDRIENVAAARSLGIEGVLVDSAAACPYGWGTVRIRLTRACKLQNDPPGRGSF